MYASCDSVEYAKTRLMSFCTIASSAAPSAVIAAMMLTVVSTHGSAWTNTSNKRPIRYTPAATMVAAWIRADTGVGPAIASGSHTCNGNCADLPTVPPNNRIAAIDTNSADTPGPSIALRERRGCRGREPGGRDQHDDAEHERHVADPRRDECLDRGVRSFWLLFPPVTDQQVGTAPSPGSRSTAGSGCRTRSPWSIAAVNSDGTTYDRVKRTSPCI